MIRTFRLIRSRHAAHAFSGEGPRLYGGRWNEEGTAAVYLADSLALAVLEVLVNAHPEELGSPYVYFHVDIPSSVAIEEVDIRKFPHTWNHPRSHTATRTFGSQWVEENRSAVLRVPSAIAPESINYILNPRHPHYPRIKVSKPMPYRFDSRLKQ